MKNLVHTSKMSLLKAFMIETGPMAPTLCHQKSTFSTNLFHVTNFPFRQLLKCDFSLQHQDFLLLKEGSLGIRKSGQNLDCSIKILIEELEITTKYCSNL